MKRARDGARSRMRGIALAAIGWSALAAAPASAELVTFLLEWTSSGSGLARGTLTLDDALCNNPGMNTLAGPAGCFVELTFTVSGDIGGRGTFTLDDMDDVLLQTGVALDFGEELLSQGPTDVNFFSEAPGPAGVDVFVMSAAGGDPEDRLTLVSMTPLVPPLSGAAAKCAAALGKAGAAYSAARHKALHACRSAFAKGASLFVDEAKTTPMLLPAECEAERKASKRIAKARRKLRRSVAKKCSDEVLAAIPSCAPSVDAVVAPAADAGCLLETVDFNIEKIVRAEFGF